MDMLRANTIDIYVQAWTSNMFIVAITNSDLVFVLPSSLGEPGTILTSTLSCLGNLPTTTGGWAGCTVALKITGALYGNIVGFLWYGHFIFPAAAL